MTLCIAAACWEAEEEPRIIICSETRVESGWAGANIAHKHAWITPHWQALMAGELSKAEDFAATCTETLKAGVFSSENIFDRLNEASAKHKAKLCERLIQTRLGMSYERFLTQGAQELTAELRNRLLYEVQDLNFGCSLIVFGFIEDDPFPSIFCIDEDGEVIRRQNFAAIGTGAVIAEAVLYQREQQNVDNIPTTLYNVFEAAAISEKSKAPGVGETRTFGLVAPSPSVNKINVVSMTGFETLAILKKYFEEYGPKSITDVSKLSVKCFQRLSACEPTIPDGIATKKTRKVPRKK